jgi:uncharacterized membrane protein (UPF0182 family)
MDKVTPLRAPRRPAGRRLRRATLIVVTTSIVVVLALAGRLLDLYVDWLWFGEVGFRPVFWTTLWSRLLLGIAAGALFFVIVAANVEIARRLAPAFKTNAAGDVEPKNEALRRHAGAIGLAVSALVAIAAAVAASSAWMTFRKALDATAFGLDDPMFGHDLGFYVFTAPAWHAVQSFVLVALLASMVLAGLMHLVLGGIDYHVKTPASNGQPASAGPVRPGAYVRSQVDVNLSGRAIAHLSAILAAVFVLVGIGQLFRAWDLLYSTAGSVYGAGYTDAVVRLPLTRVTMVLAFAIAAVLVWNVWRRRQWWPLVIVVWVVALVILRGIVPGVVQSLIVNPNQLSKERDYITRNLSATKAAYQLDRGAAKPLQMKTRITSEVLRDNEVTLRNVRLWDPDTLVTSYRQLQQLRPYYSFVDADVDRYTVKGVYTQTMVSARELDISGLPEQAQTWVNQHITYTHGFGVSMSAVNQVTKDGSPDFLVQDVPPRSVAGLEIEQPRIYYGEIGTDYTLVKTEEREFDYPGAAGDVFTEYEGAGGISISGALHKLAFAWRERTIKFFTTSAIDDDSRVIIRNNIVDRVRAVAPFLALDGDPYMVISDKRLFWIQDAYTTTDRYPYATPEGDLNYIRNSVKVVIDAYEGTMRFYVFDEDDPLLRTYRKVFPDLFTPAEEIPQELFEHVRYPEGQFMTQARIFETYHVSDPAVLYNKGDQWQIPENVSLDDNGPMSAFYVIMRLPGSGKEEFLLILPFTPNTRPNMISWLGARSDGAEYGQSVVYQFSEGATVFGPAQVEAAINQDPTISAQRSLWDQQGSRVILGNLIVVPIEDSLLYVQPLYLVSEQTQLPQLKRVIVFYRMPGEGGSESNAEQLVVMAPTLSEALTEAFGAAPAIGPPGTDGGTGTDGGGTGAEPGGAGGAGLSARALELIQQANEQFAAAQAAQQAGDWAEYGRQIELLQSTLRQLQQLQ